MASSNPRRLVAPRTAEYSKYPSFDGYLPVNYVDPTAQTLNQMGISAGNGLPANYDTMPYIATPSRLYELPRMKHIQPLTPDEQAQATRYSSIVHGPSGKYLAEPPQKLSRSQREEKRLKAKAERMDRLSSAYSNWADRNAAQRAYSKMNALKAQRERMRRWNVDWGTPEKYQMLQQSLGLKNVARKLPASITDARLLNTLQNANIRGQARTSLPAGLQRVFDDSLVSQAPQSMDPERRNQLMMAFGELVDVLHVQPIFDPRLTTPESAAEVFNPADYDIEIYDLDDNVLTPGTVIITTKFATKDFDGNIIPAGQIVAIGGYKLANPSSARSMNQLKRMAYYQANPTRADRANIPFRDWKDETYPTSKARPSGLKLIANFIRGLLEKNTNAVLPERVKVEGKYQEMPTFMKFSCLSLGSSTTSSSSSSSGAKKTYAYYKVSSVVMNTIISRMAELYFNMVIAPLLYESVEDQVPKTSTSSSSSSSEGITALSAFVDACAESIAAKFGTATMNMNNTVIITEGTPQEGFTDSPLMNMVIGWTKSYFHPKALGKFLSDATIKSLIDVAIKQSVDILSAEDARFPLGYIIGTMLHIVMLFTMNSNAEGFFDDIAGRPVNDTNSTDVIVHIISNGAFDFCTEAETNELVANYGNPNSRVNIINLSSRAWDKDIRITYNISERGKAALHPTYATKYEGATVALANPQLYQLGRAKRQARVAGLAAEDHNVLDLEGMAAEDRNVTDESPREIFTPPPTNDINYDALGDELDRMLTAPSTSSV